MGSNIHNLYIRQVKDTDMSQWQSVINRAWLAAYSHIFTVEEMENSFAGRTAQLGSWTGDRTTRLPTYVAVIGSNQIVGILGLSLRRGYDGEVTMLYVDPELQGYGVGRSLWDFALKQLRIQGCEAVQVWTLAQANATEFYRARGCLPFAQGNYSVGKHTVTSIGFRLPL